MKRCKRCYSVIEKKSSHCTSCGLEVNFKNTYYTNEKRNNVAINDRYSSNNKTNVKGVVIFFVVFYVAMFLIGIIVSLIEEETAISTPDYEFKIDVYEVDGYLYNTKLMTEDYYKVWTYALNNKITIDKITEITSLSRDDLKNSYCQALELNPTIKNAKNCVKIAYIDNGTYDAAYDDLDSLYLLLLDSNINMIQYDILSEIYMYGINLYSLMSEDTDYDIFEEKYNNSIVKIESLIQELENDSL